MFSGVERVIGKYFMVPLKERIRETLLGFINKYHFECWKVFIKNFYIYNSFIIGLYFKHTTAFQRMVTLNESFRVLFEGPQKSTNTIERLWRHLKASIPQFNRSKAFLQKLLYFYVGATPTIKTPWHFTGKFYDHLHPGRFT